MKFLKMSREDLQEMKAICIPVFVEQLAISLMALLVSAMVKGSGMAAVASVNLLNSLTVLFQQAYTAIGVGVTVVVAQYLGRGDLKSTGRAAGQSVALSVYISLAIAIGCLLFMEPILAAILSDCEPLVYEYSRIYLFYNVLSLPFIAIYTVASAAIRGSGYPRTSLWATLIHNGAYAVMAYAAVKFFNAGLLGVSIALLASRVFAAAFSIWLLWKGNKNMRVTSMPIKLEGEIMKPVFRVGFPLFLEYLLFQGGRLITQVFSVTFGTNAIAANGIVNNIHSLMIVPGHTVTNAAPPIVGKYCGQGDKKEAMRKGIQFLVLATIAMTLTCILIWFSLPWFVTLFTDVAEVQQEIIHVFGLMCIMVSLMWPLGFVTPAILRSSGDTIFSSVVIVAAMITMRIGIAYYFTQIARIGINGIWYGMYADWLFRIVFFLPRFAKGKWLEYELIKGEKAAKA